MIEAAKHPRDKALIALGYEAGLRVSELAGIKWKDIEWNDNLTKVKVRGKTGKRKLPIVIAAKYLREWMNCHPSYDGTDAELDAYVFVNIGFPRYGQPMEYRMINKIIKKAAKNAGIKKKSLSIHIETFKSNHPRKLPHRVSNECIFWLGSRK